MRGLLGWGQAAGSFAYRFPWVVLIAVLIAIGMSRGWIGPEHYPPHCDEGSSAYEPDAEDCP